MKRLPILILLLLMVLSNVQAGKNKNFNLSAATVTPKVINFIKENYVDQGRIAPFEMLKGALNQIQKSAAEILVTFEPGNRFTITIDKATKRFSPKEMNSLSDLWTTLQEVYLFIHMHYHGTIEHQDIEYLAIDGMLSVLDPHSNILTPKVFNEFKVGTKGKFGGIGIVIGNKDGNLTVISPIEGTPAWKAGIKAGDRIVQIGEESTVNMSLTEAVEMLRGDVGKDVTITIERAGRPAPFSITLKRAIINIESIQSTIVQVEGRSVGYIKVKNFQEDTSKEFTKQLSKLRESPNFSGLVLDLRNDPGGLLNQAVEIVDKFIPEGVIVSTVGAGNKFLEQETARSSGTEPPYPIIVLVNEGSASASEIVAGTLQSYKRALVMGTQTFGKGSVQTVYDLRDGSALKLTIAEYLTAGRNSIQSIGIVPDIKLVPAKIDREKMDIEEDEHETETSLEAHLKQYSETVKKEPAYKISYYQPVEKNNEEEEDRREYSKKLDISKDPPALFASRILAHAPTDSYEDLLKSAGPTISAIEKEQQKLISEALAKLGIDWSDCQPKGRAPLQVSFSIQKKDEVVTSVTAGDEVDLVMNATNMGSGPFCRLIGVSDSKEPSLKNKEFVFGRLEPSQTRSWSSRFKVPKMMPSQSLPFTVKFLEENGNTPSPFKAIIPVTGLKQPQYAFNYRLGAPERTKVQEKPIPVGKPIPFMVQVKNIGKGVSPNLVAIIKVDLEETKGVFIETGRIKIGRLEAGQSKDLTFKFKIEPSLQRSSFKMELSLIDQDLFASLSKKIEFNVATGTLTPSPGLWYEGPRISFEGTKFPLVTTSSKVRVDGEITDDHEVKDYFAFVGDDKVAYSANPERSPKCRISLDLPVKEGNNAVSVIARDDQDLITRYNFVIEKK